MRDVLLTLDCWGADILKLAVMPREEADVERLRMAGREASVRTGHPVIAIAMGELGKRSRTQAERFGSAVTFGCLGRASAPGQVPWRSWRGFGTSDQIGVQGEQVPAKSAGARFHKKSMDSCRV